MNFSVNLSICLLLASVLASAQNLIGTKGAFHTERGVVTIERFDPKKGGSHPAIMVVHSGAGPEGDWRHSGVLEDLVSAGYSVFIPHYFDDIGKWSPADKPEKFLGYIKTLNDATRYIARQPDVHTAEIGVVGISLGGYLSLGLAEETRSHPPHLRSPAIRAVVEMYGGMPGFAIPRMTTMPPVLILHGEDDDLVPVSEAHKLETVLQNKSIPYQIKVYRHQGHGFIGDALQDANRRTVAFLHTYIR